MIIEYLKVEAPGSLVPTPQYITFIQIVPEVEHPALNVSDPPDANGLPTLITSPDTALASEKVSTLPVPVTMLGKSRLGEVLV